MLYKIISLVLAAALVHGSITAQDQSQQSPAQTAANMQQVLQKTQEKDKSVKVTLIRAIDNQRKFSGKVREISDTDFVLMDQKTGTTKKLAFQDVQEIKQKGMSRGWKIALVVLAGVIITVVIVGETISD